MLLTSILTKILVHTTPEQTARKRRRNAARNAAGQLKKIQQAQLQSHPELLAEAMKQFVGQRFGKVAGSLTADDCKQVIISGTGDSELANQFRDIISDCEAARYSAVQRQIDSATIENVSKLIRTIDKKSKI